MIRIFLEDSFDSAHFLPNVPTRHKCHNLHGHTYRVRLEVQGDMDPYMGWIIDYAEVKDKWDGVKIGLDHKNLNDVVGLSNSTCENVASWIWSYLKPILPGLCRIELRETERAGVIYDGRP